MAKLLCYLCGKEIEQQDLSADHVPPRQFYAASLRKKFKLDKIETIPSHTSCNKSYQNDEDYFVNTLGPVVMNSSRSGRALWEDIKKNLQREGGKGRILGKKVSKEFIDRTDAGIILPGELMLKKFEGNRVWRVVWKIVRGLFYKEYKIILPDNTIRVFDLLQPEIKHSPEEFRYVRDTPSRGIYGEVFDYKYIMVKELNNFHYWAFLLWDKIIMTIAFHDPDCICKQCKVS